MYVNYVNVVKLESTNNTSTDFSLMLTQKIYFFNLQAYGSDG